MGLWSIARGRSLFYSDGMRAHVGYPIFTMALPGSADLLTLILGIVDEFENETLLRTACASLLKLGFYNLDLSPYVWALGN